MNALPVEMQLVCRPLDNFFDQVTRTGEVDDVDGRAVFVNDITHQLMSIKESGNGLLDSIEALFNHKKLGRELIPPMRNLFENIDSCEFTLAEVDAGADAWDKAKSIIKQCTYGEVVYFSSCEWKKDVIPTLRSAECN